MSYLGILSQYTIRKTKIDCQRFQDVFPIKENMSDSLDKHVNKHTCTWSSWEASFLFVKNNKRKTEAASSQTECSVFKRNQCHIDERTLTYTVLSVLTDQIFSTWRILILLSIKCLCYGCCFCEPIKTFVFWHLSNDCQISNRLSCTCCRSPKQEVI